MGRLFDEFGVSDEDFRLTLKPTLYEEFGIETPALESDQFQTQTGPPPRWGGKTTDDFIIDPMLTGFGNLPEEAIQTAAGWTPTLGLQTEEEAARMAIEAEMTKHPNVYDPGSIPYYSQMFGETALGAAGIGISLPIAMAGAPLWGAGLALLYGGTYGYGISRAGSLAEGQYDPEVMFDEAVIRGINSAVWESISEAVPIPFLSKFLRTPAGKGLRNKLVDVAKKAAGAYLVEGGSEAAGQAADNAVMGYLYGDEFDLQGLIDSFVVGGAWGTTVVSPIVAARNVTSALAESQTAADLGTAAQPGFDLSAQAAPPRSVPFHTMAQDMEYEPEAIADPSIDTTPTDAAGTPVFDPAGAATIDSTTGEIEFEGEPGPQQKERAAAAVLERELANDAEALNTVGQKPMGEEEGAESIINRPKNINEFIAKQLNLTNNDKIRSFFNGLKATGKQALNSIGLSVINTEQGEEILLREAYNTIKIADEVQTKHLNEMGEPERTKEGLPVPRKFEGIPYIFQYGRWIQQKLVTDKSDQLKVIALQRAINPDFEKNYKELEEILRIYGQLYSDTVGGKKLNVEFELNPTNADIGGVYIVGENTLRIPMESLMKGGINGVTAATAVHELLHGKFYSLHELTARRNLKKRGIQNPSKQDVRNETYRVANQFASVILPKMRSLVHKFLKGKIQEYTRNRADTQTNRKKGQEYLSDVLAINNNDPLFGATLEHLEAAAFGNSRLLNQDGTDRAGTLAYVILQEMLAYYKPLADEVTFTARISKEDRRTFIKQFIDGVIKAWKTTFSRDYAPSVITEDMMLQFGIALFYDTAGEKITETARKTKFYAAGKTDEDLPGILGQDAGELRSVEQPPRVSIEEEASLPELEQQLVTAKDRLKLLNRRIAPQGFEDEYSPEDFARDISTTKDTINTLKEEIKATRKGLRQRDVGKAEDVDLSKRKFLKQTGGIVAGAAVDPTILAEGATKVATTAAAKPWIGKAAISTIYRFAVSKGVETESGEVVEGEAVFEIIYDSDEPNTIEVRENWGDGGEVVDSFDISGEEGLEAGEYVDLEMHDVDKIASDMITEGITPDGSKTIWDTKAVYSVQEPMRDPWGDEGGEGGEMTRGDHVPYEPTNKRFLDNVSGEETKVLGPVDSKETAPELRGEAVRAQRESYVPGIDPDSGYIYSEGELEEARAKKRAEAKTSNIPGKILEKALTEKSKELIEEGTEEFIEAVEEEAYTEEEKVERRKKKLAAKKAKKEEPKALPAPKDEEGLRQVHLAHSYPPKITKEVKTFANELRKNGSINIKNMVELVFPTLKESKYFNVLIKPLKNNFVQFIAQIMRSKDAITSDESRYIPVESRQTAGEYSMEFNIVASLLLMFPVEITPTLDNIIFGRRSKYLGEAIYLQPKDIAKLLINLYSETKPGVYPYSNTFLHSTEWEQTGNTQITAKVITSQIIRMDRRLSGENVFDYDINGVEQISDMVEKIRNNAVNQRIKLHTRTAQLDYALGDYIARNYRDSDYFLKTSIQDALEMLGNDFNKLLSEINKKEFKIKYVNWEKLNDKQKKIFVKHVVDHYKKLDKSSLIEPALIEMYGNIVGSKKTVSQRIAAANRAAAVVQAKKNTLDVLFVLFKGLTDNPVAKLLRKEAFKGINEKVTKQLLKDRTLTNEQAIEIIENSYSLYGEKGGALGKLGDRQRKEMTSFAEHLGKLLGIEFEADHIIQLYLEGKNSEAIGGLHFWGIYMPIPKSINSRIANTSRRKIEWINGIPQDDKGIAKAYFTAFYDAIASAKDNPKMSFIEATKIATKAAQKQAKSKGTTLTTIDKKRVSKKEKETFEEMISIPEAETRIELYKSKEDTKEFIAESKLLKKQIKLQEQFREDPDSKNIVDTLGDDYNGEEGLRSVSPATKPEATEYKRNAGQHQRFWTNFATFMWSKPVEALRRYRYASLTMAKLADMIQRDPSETKRVSGLKGGLDYIQRKGMAMGQFRVALQASLDVLTGRFGVIDKDTNDAVVKFLVQDTPISDPKIAKAAQRVKEILEGIYVWSHEHGEKGTKGFSLRPLDGGLLPRVWNIEELNTEAGRKKFMKLLERIGIVDNPDAKNDYEKYAATDAYNIAINSGGFISGDFTTTAYNQKSKRIRKYQVELFEKIEKEVSRKDLGTLLVNDLQASLPRFVDKAVEKTLYAELFGHYDEKLWDMKAEIEKEIADYNRKDSTKRRVNPEAAMKEVNDMMDIIRHRYKMDTAWFGARRFTQWFMNFATVTLMPLVTLASMPEFFTPLALGSKNPVGFMNDLRMAGVYAGLRAMNGMSKIFRGKQLDAMLYPKGKTAKRAMFLKALGIIDIKTQGESAAVRYVGPSFIRTGIAAQGMGSKLIMKNLYKLFGLGDIPKGRFKARKGRAVFNMDTVFEMYLLTTVTQMQQVMAANNLQRYVLSTLKSLSKAQKGKKGVKLDSTIKQQIKILKDFGLTGAEIKEAIRWYDAGHREFYDVPGEFNWDPRGITLRFVDQVITRPNEATAAKAFRHPGMAPLLLFKSFMTTYANTYMVAIRDRVRFAEGEGTEKAYQQAKMAAGLLATFAAMYGMVLFTQAVRQMIQYGDDDDDYMQDVPEWKKFIGLVNRTGLLTAPGAQLADIWLPYKYGWWQRPSERLQSTLFGPGVNQAKSILDLVGDLANKGEVDIEKFLGQVVPVTKYEAFRDIVGAPSYYEKD